jgi:Protein of unknown function (DUF2950)
MENEIMSTKNLISKTSSRPKLNWVAALSALALLVAGISQSSLAQKSGPETFSSPWKASSALFQAVQNNDEKALERILGVGKEITLSSDAIEDKFERERFSEKYQEMHRLVREPDGSTVLYIGAENWPFPIPLFSRNGAWHFDSDTGKQEILFRTIGENETTAIEVCEEFALTKTEGDAKAASNAKAASEDPITRFAQGLVTAGATIADSNARPTDDKEPDLFHGYYFRQVTGDSAAGTRSSVAGNNMKDGVALVAYPADYRSSGVKSFIVTTGGIVYEKDLGSKTTLAKDLKRGPDSSWHNAE